MTNEILPLPYQTVTPDMPQQGQLGQQAQWLDLRTK